MQTVLYNASIITMNAEREILNNGTVVIEDNKILEAGSAVDRTKYPSAEQIDCTGKVILPGFINMHTHQTLSIARGISEDMGTAPAYTRSVPQGQSLSEEESEIMASLGAAEALRFGSTYIADMYVNCERNAAAFEKLGIRSAVSEMVHDMNLYTLYKEEYTADPAMGHELLDKNIALIEKYQDHELVDCCLGLHAPDTCSKSFIKEILKVQEKYSVPIATHLAQSMKEVRRISAYADGLSPTAFMEQMGVLERPLFAAHCIYVDNEDIERLSENRVNVVHVPEGNAKGGMAAPIHKMRGTGINLTIGTDNCSADMIDAMRIALCVGRVLTGTYDQPIPMQVLEMATVNGAAALGREKELGSIEKGKLADLLILDYRKPHLIPCLNPLGILLHTALGSDIETVYINGKKVVDHGRILTIDVDSLVLEAQKVAERQWKAANHDIDDKYFIML